MGVFRFLGLLEIEIRRMREKKRKQMKSLCFLRVGLRFSTLGLSEESFKFSVPFFLFGFT